MCVHNIVIERLWFYSMEPLSLVACNICSLLAIGYSIISKRENMQTCNLLYAYEYV